MKQVTVKGVVWTKEKVLEYLDKREDFLLQSIVLIYQRQDDDEQTIQQTARNNGRGFNKADANYLSECANLLIHGKLLYPNRLVEAKQRMKKYANQILLVIEERNG